MGDAFFTVKEVSTRFIDPVVEQLMYSLIERLGLSDFFNNCYYVFNGRSTVSKSDDTQGNMRMGNNRCDVTVETHLNPSVQMWDRLIDYNSPSTGTSKLWVDRYEKLWHDPVVGVMLTEQTVPFGVSMTVELTFKSWDSAQMALDRITTISGGNVENQIHDITYSYPIELSLMGLWGRIYRARKSINTQMTFYQYVQKYMLAQMEVDVNKYDVGAANPNIEYCFKKYQLSCLALMQCDQESPEPTMQDDIADAWKVTFTYKFQSGRPQTLYMMFPPVVEQQLLPNVMFDKPEISWCSKIAGSFQYTTFTRAFQNFSDIRSDTQVIFRFPTYDDWTVPQDCEIRRYGYDQLLIGIVTADDDETASVSFNQLGKVTLHPKVLEILGQHSASDLFDISAIFNVSVFVNNIPLDPSIMTFDPETLTVSWVADRLQGIYRIVLSEASSIRILDPKWQTTIIQNRFFYPMTIFRNMAYLVSMGRYVVTSDDKLINLIKYLNKSDKLWYYIDRMVKGGFCDGQAFHYTQTSTQFADFITNTQAHMDRNTTSDDDYYSKTLFDVLMDMLEADGIIRPGNRPQEYMRTPKGYPYGSGAGGWLSFNTPLRVQHTNLEMITGK